MNSKALPCVSFCYSIRSKPGEDLELRCVACYPCYTFTNITYGCHGLPWSLRLWRKLKILIRESPNGGISTWHQRLHTFCKVPECVSTLPCWQDPFLILESSPLLPLGASVSSHCCIWLQLTCAGDGLCNWNAKVQLPPNKGIIWPVV